MIGTPKQVAWATRIRAARIAELEALFASTPTDDPVKLANRAKILDALYSDAIPAKCYIDDRHYDAGNFAQGVLTQVNAREMPHSYDGDARMCELAALKDRILNSDNPC